MRYQRYLIVRIILLSCAVAGAFWLQINGIRRVKRENLEQKQLSVTKAIVRDLELGFFLKYSDYVTNISSSNLLTSALQDDSVSLNSVLDLAWKSTSADIAYMLGPSGMCSASRGQDEKAAEMVGETYKFRSYFQQAVQGNPHISFAAGVTTGEIGIYFSSPVKIGNEVVGVFVLKVNPEYVYNTLESEKLPLVIVSQNGVVVASNRDQWLYSGLFPLTNGSLERLSKTRQFEGVPLNPEGILPAVSKSYALSSQGRPVVLHTAVENSEVRESSVFQESLIYSQTLPVMGWQLISIAGIKEYAFLHLQQKVFFIKSSLFLLVIIVISTALFFNYYIGANLKSDLRKLYSAVEQSPGTVLMTDPEGKIEYVNPSFAQLTGYSRREALGRKASLLKSGHHDEKFYAHLWETIARGNKWKGEFLNRRKNGTLYWESALISPVKDRRGTTISYIAFKEDITEKKMHHEIVNKRARVDELTQVPNRRTGLETLNRVVDQCYSNNNSLTVGFVDVNNLKEVNDTLGHGAGDTLIKTVAQAIHRNIRESDSLARLGGDEFLIVLPGCTRNRAEKIWQKIELDFSMAPTGYEGKFEVSASIGFAELKEFEEFPEVDSEAIPRELLRKADERMYAHKQIVKEKMGKL